MRGHCLVVLLVGAMVTGSSGPVVAASESAIVDDVYRAITTVRDIYSLAVALEAYQRDNGEFPEVSSTGDLKALLQPIYARHIAAEDAWGTPIKYLRTPDGQGCRLVSAGSDRTFDESSWDRAGVFKDSRQDAVFQTHFVRKWAIDIP